MRYLYAHDYQIDDNGKPPLIAHARVYAIADKYGVESLKDLAKAQFVTAIEDTTSADISTSIAAVEVVYTSTLASDRGLRDCIIPELKEIKQQLRDSDDFIALIVSGLGDGEFGVEVIDAWADMQQTRRD